MENDTLNESDCQRISTYPIYPRVFKVHSDRGFVNINNGPQGGTHWCCFKIKDNKSFYLDSFGVRTDKFQIEKLPKPIIYFNYKIQDLISKLCRSYCLYFFYLIERMNYYDAISKKCFG